MPSRLLHLLPVAAGVLVWTHSASGTDEPAPTLASLRQAVLKDHGWQETGKAFNEFFAAQNDDRLRELIDDPDNSVA